MRSQRSDFFFEIRQRLLELEAKLLKEENHVLESALAAALGLA
jgi:hypothetical protein